MPSEHGLRATDHRILLLPAVILALLVGLQQGWRVLEPLNANSTTNGRSEADVTLQPVSGQSAEQILARFESTGYTWPPEEAVPTLAVQQFPDDIGELAVDERKALFFQSLLPLLLVENARLRHKRGRLQELFAGGSLELDGPAWQFVAELLYRYQLSGDPNDPQTRRELLRRVDEIPIDMALAQAANESGWGTSRFAQEANNLFGVWTWDADQGMVPENRPEGASHYVRVFPDLHASVRNYVYTLNVGDAYEELRLLREQRRQEGRPLHGLELAQGLSRYSQRGVAYVEEVQSMIRTNRLGELTTLELQPNSE